MAKSKKASESHFEQYRASIDNEGGNKPKKPKASPRFSFFLLAMGFFGLANFLVFNDIATIWPGAESNTIAAALQEGDRFYWIIEAIALIPLDFPYWLFATRLVCLSGIILALIIFVSRASRIFGTRAIQFTILVVLASFFLPIQAKLATGDGFAFLGQCLLWLYSIKNLKGDGRTSITGLLTASTIAAFAAPINTFVFTLVLCFGWWRWHPQGKTVWRWPGLYMVFVLSLIGWWLSGTSGLVVPYLTWGMHWADYFSLLGYCLLGMLPFAGFLIAAIRDLAYKIKKGEELSIVILVSLFAAFWGQSLLFPLLLAFMAAKQMIAYFHEHYPWKDWVRTGAMLQLVFMFVFIVMILIGGYLSLEGQGFRAAIGCSFAYWMFSLMGVVGLFGMKKDLVWGGPIMAGILSLLFFWVQLYPFWESHRNWPIELTERAQRDQISTIVLPIDQQGSVAIPYLLQKGIEVNFQGHSPIQDYENQTTETKSWRLVPKADSTKVTPENPLHILSGRDHRLRLEEWWIYK